MDNFKKLPYDWGHIVYIASIHLGALLAFLPSNFNWKAVGVALILYFITGALGITLGFHRLISHRSFQTSNRIDSLFTRRMAFCHLGNFCSFNNDVSCYLVC